jgi:hypothetical protein
MSNLSARFAVAVVTTRLFAVAVITTRFFALALVAVITTRLFAVTVITTRFFAVAVITTRFFAVTVITTRFFAVAVVTTRFFAVAVITVVTGFAVGTVGRRMSHMFTDSTSLVQERWAYDLSSGSDIVAGVFFLGASGVTTNFAEHNSIL